MHRTSSNRTTAFTKTWNILESNGEAFNIL